MTDGPGVPRRAEVEVLCSCGAAVAIVVRDLDAETFTVFDAGRNEIWSAREGVLAAHQVVKEMTCPSCGKRARLTKYQLADQVHAALSPVSADHADPEEPVAPSGEWLPTLVGAVPKEEAAGGALELLRAPSTRSRMVDLICSKGQEMVGAVVDTPGEPTFVIWTPPLGVVQDKRRGQLWSVQAGPVPAADVGVTVHCFKHGHGRVLGRELLGETAAYRKRGKRRRLVVTVG